jgi:hypothetical protein
MPNFTLEQSKAISHAGYNDERRELYITFRDSGETYAYLDVPRHEYDELLAAESMGHFVAIRIKPRYRKYQRLKDAS